MSLNSYKRIGLLIFVYLLILTFNKNLAQTQVYDVYTPFGSLVLDTYITPQLSHAEVQSLENWMYFNWPNAIILELAPVSGTYNCHGYAWYASEGNPKRWIGYYTVWAEDIFWQDGSYLEQTTQSSGQKVSYLPDYQANHSAVTTSVNNIFRSKWGAGPLTQHSYNYCPYWEQGTTYLKYYGRTQYPSSPLEANQLNPLLKKHYSFFDYEPEILLYSQKKSIKDKE